MFRKSFLAICGLMLAACSSVGTAPIQISPVSIEGTGLVYGQLLLPEKAGNMEKVLIQRLDAFLAGMDPLENHETVQVLSDGHFLAENLKPGWYLLTGFATDRQVNVLGKAALLYAAEVMPDTVEYFGTYRYVTVYQQATDRAEGFNLVHASSTEAQAELLHWVEQVSRTSSWHARIQQERTALLAP